jgi:hypothetical protein
MSVTSIMMFSETNELAFCRTDTPEQTNHNANCCFALNHFSWLLGQMFNRLAWIGVGLAAGTGLTYGWKKAHADRTDHPEDYPLPGSSMRTTTKALDLGGAVLQHFTPVKKIHLCVCGVHFNSDSPKEQQIAYHYCSQLNEDIRQCILYDSDQPTARLIGVEYIISEKLFKTLPPEEQALWHSHGFEVKSGLLVSPGLPELAEHAVMERLVSTYGKAYLTWAVHKHDPLPLGVPSLLMAFKNENQIDKELLDTQRKRLGVDMMTKKQARMDIKETKPIGMADSWSSGRIISIQRQDDTSSNSSQRFRTAVSASPETH